MKHLIVDDDCSNVLKGMFDLSLYGTSDAMITVVDKTDTAVLVVQRPKLNFTSRFRSVKRERRGHTGKKQNILVLTGYVNTPDRLQKINYVSVTFYTPGR